MGKGYTKKRERERRETLPRCRGNPTIIGPVLSAALLLPQCHFSDHLSAADPQSNTLAKMALLKKQPA